MIEGKTIDEIKKSLEESFSRALSFKVNLDDVFSYKDKELDTGETHNIHLLAFTVECYDKLSELKDLSIFVVPQVGEIAFLNKYETIPLPCMTLEELEELKDDEYTTIEIDRVDDGDIQSVIDNICGNSIKYNAEQMAHYASEKLSPAKTVTNIFDYDKDTLLLVINVMFKKDMLGFIDCFLAKNDCGAEFYAIKNNLNKPIPDLDMCEFPSLDAAIEYLLQD